MSINDLVDQLDDLVLRATLKAKAVKPCHFHRDVLIYRGDPDADRHAYAIATNLWKSDGRTFDREEVTAAVKDVLDQCADGECPECSKHRDE